MCYNIKKISQKGRAKPLLSLYRSIGLFIGAIIFLISCAFCDDLIFNVSYSGTGIVCQSQVEEFLYSKGIKKFTTFSSIDLNKLEDEILASNKNLSFVSCEKSGNTLKISLVFAKDKLPTLDGTKDALVSDVDGKIRSLKVYRGTALVSVGDCVKARDTLVDGYVMIREEKVQTNVIASAVIECEKILTYYSEKDNEQSIYQILAEQEIKEEHVESSTVIKQKIDDGYEYLVTINYLRILLVG